VFGLLEALLELGAWAAASELVARLEGAGCFGAFTHPPLRRQLLKLVDRLVNPLYKEHCCPRAKGRLLLLTSDLNNNNNNNNGASGGDASSSSTGSDGSSGASSLALPSSSSSSLKSSCLNTSSEQQWRLAPPTSFATLAQVVGGPLRLLGCGLADSPVLFAKLCRLLNALLLLTQPSASLAAGAGAAAAAGSGGGNGASMEDDTDNGAAAAAAAAAAAPAAATTPLLTSFNDRVAFVCEVLQVTVLPACSLLSCNPGLTFELWAVLGALPYSVR
jgi:hypothetical protein